jgi:hypothetical protein
MGTCRLPEAVRADRTDRSALLAQAKISSYRLRTRRIPGPALAGIPRKVNRQNRM